MIISILLHGAIKSIKNRRNMFPSLFYGIEIGGIIKTENGLRTVLKNETKKQKRKIEY
jgi:hypothetical protein